MVREAACGRIIPITGWEFPTRIRLWQIDSEGTSLAAAEPFVREPRAANLAGNDLLATRDGPAARLNPTAFPL